MPIPKLSESIIRAHAAPESFSRGRSYYDRGAVISLAQRGNTLQGQVEGSQYTPYHVRIIFDEGGITTATCTCPYDWGGWCKHIVAVLLKGMHEAGEIETRPALDALLADLDRAQLQALLVGLADRDPDLADAIERQVALLRLADAAPQARQAGGHTRRTAIDQQAIRRQVRALMRAAGREDYYDDYDGGGDALEGVRELLEQARRFTEGGDARNAMVILESITEEVLAGYGDLYDYGYEDAGGEFFPQLAEVWTEAVLSADPSTGSGQGLTADERRAWAEKFAGWRRAADNYGEGESFRMVETAAEQGWDAPALQRVLAGEITERGAWEGESPDYADELALVRLKLLERQGRYQEYLYLAEAEGQIERYLVMLANLGRTEDAVEEGLKYLATPNDALALAKALRDRGALDGAMRIAEHGLALTEGVQAEVAYAIYSEHQKASLAEWLADLAAGMGDRERALRAAEVAFRAAPSLNGYLKVQELAGNHWSTLKPDLLEHLRRRPAYIGDANVDIFLHERLIDDAIAAVKDGYHHMALGRVMDAALATRPDWVIQAASAQAERIIDAGDAQHYDVAVEWLRRTREAFRAAGRQGDWQGYLQSIRLKHGRKYKLMGLLERL